MSDCIHLTGIRAYGYTGLFAEEQTLGQWFEINLTLRLDLKQASESDRLEDTYDYGSDVAAIVKLVETSRFKLLEKLAAEIAKIALQSGRVKQVTVRLTKMHPPIPDFTGSVSIEITRDRH
ncbi:dihydroneopterin aldolase [Microcoleus sp. FACHB-1515]|uniref:dihydroneopterin aldolase n=1 Tax=Cyanophyceae TaxID=3028117 RepID=UPI001686E613|nr:dihydroneopterin aldolase [Microcoleus sp. FACHB-1515]MBD2092024.1 dihydroneopterin aldolase [Microcoleus sp. FACHB-1515]